MPQQAPRREIFSTAFKAAMGGLGVLATIVTILTFARQEGMIGPIATIGVNVARIRLTPVTDTAWALGDTLSYAAIATDTNGVVLPTPLLIWTIANSEVAEARPDGSVIATGSGETSVVVTAGAASARARVVVHPRTVELRPAADTVQVPEGSATSLIAIPYDVRGRMIRGVLARWRSFDTTVVQVDSLGLATATRPGLAATEARLDGVNARLYVRVTPVLGSLALGSGADQHARAGRDLPAPVVVRTLSRQGQPIGGILIRAAVDQGRLETDTVRSDDNGAARFRWTLGDRPGPQHFVARADRLDTTYAVGAEADPVTENTVFTLVDSLGTARAGSALSSFVTIRLTDTLGQVLPDIPVRWLGLDGSRITPTGPRTDSLGLATATWTLGPKVGRNRARIIAGPGSAPSFAFETRSDAGAPAVITVLSGDRQRSTVASTLRVRVRVSDAAGNPVPDAALQSEMVAGSVALTDPVSTADGTVRLNWTLGPTAGAQEVTLKIGAARVKLIATALPAPAAKVEIVSPTISITSSASLRVIAVVTDSLGNPIAGSVLQPTVTAGSISPRRATTDARGRATFTWTLARRQGDQTIRIHAAGVRVNAEKTVRRPNSR
jgi:hypothetical protein